jgi:hypothetical protein
MSVLGIVASRECRSRECRSRDGRSRNGRSRDCRCITNVYFLDYLQYVGLTKKESCLGIGNTEAPHLSLPLLSKFLTKDSKPGAGTFKPSFKFGRRFF